MIDLPVYEQMNNGLYQIDPDGYVFSLIYDMDWAFLLNIFEKCHKNILLTITK